MNGKFQQALSYFQSGNFAAAEIICDALLANDEKNADALHLLGLISANSGNRDRAEALLSAASNTQPGNPILLLNLANIQSQLGKMVEASENFNRALSINPNHAGACNGLANIQMVKGEFEAAELNFRRAIAIDPRHSAALYNLGNLLYDARRYEEAVECFKSAIILQPGLNSAYNNIGLALVELGRHAEAIEYYRKAIRNDPSFADAYTHLGIALVAIRKCDEGVQAYQQALTIDPNSVDANWNLGLCLMLQGELASGWDQLEWRWKHESFAKRVRPYTQPYLDKGQNICGKTVFVYAEQGLGDTLHFCRYIPLLVRAGAKVKLEVQTSLISLLSQFEGVNDIFALGETNPGQFDYHCSVLSLPRAFGTTLDSIPSNIPYLRSDARSKDKWAAQLGQKRKPRIGLVWSGNPEQADDKYRSMSFSKISALIDDRFEWISLQKDVRSDDSELLYGTKNILPWGSKLEDFSDTAGLIENLDLVISVCTSVAHLAGAMGKPLWVLLSYNAEWRWLLDRSESPWYPTARLFRQNSMQDWSNVIAEVGLQLSAMGRDFQ
jgi:tetratricopeptide (TPR) repeat protein